MEERPIVTRASIVSRDWKRGQRPAYSVKQLALLFFGMSDSWLRGKLADRKRAAKGLPLSWFTYPDGTEMEFNRADPADKTSSRVFLLSDVEPMARALHRQGALHRVPAKNDERLAIILDIVRAQKQLYGLDDGDDG